MITPASCQIPTGLKRGSRGPGVRILQEWLTLAGHPITVDSDFGPATERALDRMRRSRWGDGSPASSVATTKADTDVLIGPMVRAIGLHGSLVDIARAYLAEHPREVGGANRGPWVRLFCGDVEGQAWCAYFVRHLARQAGDPWAERISPSVDVTGKRARLDGRLSTAPTVGGLFLVRGPSEANPWTHTGLVTAIGNGWVSTIEGNTNDEGSREGYEVCARTRGVAKLDFVKLGAADTLAAA